MVYRKDQGTIENNDNNNNYNLERLIFKYLLVKKCLEKELSTFTQIT